MQRNSLSSGNLFGFRPLQALRLQEMRFPTACVKSFARSAAGMVERPESERY
jgi:ribulose-bisphosphate carboxylase large chain